MSAACNLGKIDFLLLFLGDQISLFQHECPFIIISSSLHPEIKYSWGMGEKTGVLGWADEKIGDWIALGGFGIMGILESWPSDQTLTESMRL